jgi:ketosteroid isomerase-like protein
MKSAILTLCLTLAALAADPRQELLDADRAFARATAERGLDGWMSFFARDARLNSPQGHLQGHSALRAYYAAVFIPGFTLEWEPFHAEASADGSMGYTLGTSVATARGPNGETKVRRGRYLTVWRRQADGSWKVVTDLGN